MSYSSGIWVSTINESFVSSVQILNKVSICFNKVSWSCQLAQIRTYNFSKGTRMAIEMIFKLNRSAQISTF